MKRTIVKMILTFLSVSMLICGLTACFTSSETSYSEEDVPQVVDTPKAGVTPNLIETMNDEEFTKLNIFLSNFAETFFDDFDSTKEINESKLIFFAFFHDYVNNHENVKYTHLDDGYDYMGITGERVLEIIDRFFGLTVSLDDKVTERNKYGYYDGFIYRDGCFLIPAASGEDRNYFIIATDMTKNDNGTYTVKFNNFYAGWEYEESMDKLYSYTLEKAMAQFIDYSAGEAVIKEKTYNGTDTYEILKFDIYNK